MEIETSTRSSHAKVVLWSTYRSLSTAFERCMRNLPDVEGFHEPLTEAAYFGLIEERFGGLTAAPPKRGLSYKQVKTKLEDFRIDRSNLFIKDMALNMVNGHLDKIPEGFRHSFLIRHPAKVIISYFRATARAKEMGLPYSTEFRADEIGIQEILTLYNYLVKEKIECEPIIVDADDLQRNPAMMMQKYCQAVGIPYNKCMLTWKPEISQKFMEELTRFGPVELWHGTLLSRDGLHPSSPSNGDDIDVTVYPEEVQLAIQDCMPSYKQLYECRLR
ncbi:uncharacterized protein LOC144443124 [Glandiceps talaboti]